MENPAEETVRDLQEGLSERASEAREGLLTRIALTTALIAALAAGDAKRASAVMADHLEAVANRALIVSRPPKNRDLKDILASYSDEATAAPAKRKRR